MDTHEQFARVQSLEKLLQLELASADLMDALLMDWAQNMRGMARHNVALETVVREMVDYCSEVGMDLGGLCDKAIRIVNLEE